jgi:hypothetical protein
MTPLKVPERRKNTRFPLAMQADISFPDDVLEAKIFDLTPSGAKIRLSKSLLKNVVLNILPFGSFEGEIVWSDDEFIGIKFKEDHKAIVNLILEREVEDAP